MQARRNHDELINKPGGERSLWELASWRQLLLDRSGYVPIQLSRLVVAWYLGAMRRRTARFAARPHLNATRPKHNRR